MEQRLSIVTLGVRDMARARAFYERLGWRASSASSDDVAFYRAGGVVLGLYGRTALAEDAKVSPDGEGFAGVALAHNTASREAVDAVIAEAAGGRRDGHKACRGCVLGRLFGILRRSGRPPLGS